MIERVYHWLLIRGSIGLVVFVLSTAMSAIVPGFLGGRVASHIESRANL